MMINVTLPEQLSSNVGKTVRLVGVLGQTRSGTYISLKERENVYLEPPPDLSEVKLGSRVGIEGTLASRVWPTYDPNVAVARPTNAQAMTEYYLNNYRITAANDNP